MDRHSQESEKPADTKPAAGFSPKPGAAQQQGPSCAVKGRTLPGGHDPRLQSQGAWARGEQESRGWGTWWKGVRAFIQEVKTQDSRWET